MNKKEFKQKYKKIRRQITSHLVFVVFFPLMLFPHKFIFELAVFLIVPIMKLLKRDYKVAKNNLLQAGYSNEEAEVIINRMFKNFAAVSVDNIFFLKIYNDLLRTVTVSKELEEFFRKSKNDKRGTIAVTPHLGNWELLSFSLCSILKLNAKVIAKKSPYKNVNVILNSIRQKAKTSIFYQHESPKPLIKFLKNSGLVGILPDQDIPRLSGEFITYFGRKAFTPTSPASLAIITNSVILPLFSYRSTNGKLYLFSGEVIKPEDFKGSKKQRVKDITQKWSDEFEKVIRKYPHQWVWFHNRWKSDEKTIEDHRKAR